MSVVRRQEIADDFDYDFDFASEWLRPGETIVTHIEIADPGITMHSITLAAGRVKVWLTGGTDRHQYDVTCTITTNQARTKSWGLRVVTFAAI